MESVQHAEVPKSAIRLSDETPKSAPSCGERSRDDNPIAGDGDIKRAFNAESVHEIIDVIALSPLPLGVFERATDLLYVGNKALHALLEIHTPPGSPCKLRDILPSECVSRIVSTLEQVEHHRVAVHENEITFYQPESHQPIDAIRRHRLVWQISAWPTLSIDARQEFILVQINDLTKECDARDNRAKMVEELREINSRLVIATLREEDLKVQAQAAATAKTNFLATMSHELRTPLSAIIGYQELLASRISGPISDLQMQQLGRIKASALHLLDLINDVLTLARAEAGEETVNLRNVVLRDLVNGAMSLVEPLAQSKGLEFQSYMDGAETVLETDELKVRQILVNLLGNAVKFTDTGSISLDVALHDDVVFCRVIDSGIGIAPEHVERIFDSFWQIHQSPSRRVGGSGLGLSVSRRLARLLGGDIDIQSEVGKGSIFTFRIPVEPPHERADRRTSMMA